MPNLLKISLVVRKHYVAIILALIVGAISVAPQVYITFDDNYKGIQMFGADAEYDYVAKVNKAMSEDYSVGIFPPDSGKNYYLAPELGERLMALSANLLNVSAVTVNVVFKILCSIILFLLIYGWLFQISSRKDVALLAPLFLLLGINLLSPSDFIGFFSMKTSIGSFLPYTRPISPQISSIFLFACWWLIYRMETKSSGYRSAIVAGVLSGLSLYSYIYTWSFVAVLMGVYFLHHLIRQNFYKAKLFFSAIIINIFVCTPFFINMLKARSDQDYVDTSARIGGIHTHLPILGVWFVAGLIILLLLWRSMPDIKKFFILSFVALAISLNQQVITGFQIQPGHYHWYITKPLVGIIVTFALIFWLSRYIRSQQILRIIKIGLGIAFIANGLLVQTHSFNINYPKYLSDQKSSDLIKHLNDLPVSKNIWAEPELSTLIMAYTKHSAPNNIHAQYYLDSQEHRKNMLFLDYRVKGIKASQIENVLQGDIDNVTSRIHGIYYRDLPGNKSMPQSELDQIATEYKAFSRIPLAQAFKENKIDIIVASDLKSISYVR